MSTITFSGESRCIAINLGAQESSATVKVSDIYRAWKNWVSQSDNLKYLQAIRPVGGEPLNEIERLGSAFFLVEEWRICPIPTEVETKLTIDGNLFPEPATNPVLSYHMVPSGLHTHVEMRTSTLPVTMITQVNTGSGLSAEERATLLAIESLASQLLSGSLTRDDFKKLLINRNNTVVDGKITQYRVNNEFDVVVERNSEGIPTREAINE